MTQEELQKQSEEIRAITLAQSMAVQGALALQDAVAAARDAMTARQMMFQSMIAEAKDLPLKERLVFLKDLYSTHSDLTDRMDKVFKDMDNLKANVVPGGGD